MSVVTQKISCQLVDFDVQSSLQYIEFHISISRLFDLDRMGSSPVRTVEPRPTSVEN